MHFNHSNLSISLIGRIKNSTQFAIKIYANLTTAEPIVASFEIFTYKKGPYFLKGTNVEIEVGVINDIFNMMDIKDYNGRSFKLDSSTINDGELGTYSETLEDQINILPKIWLAGRMFQFTVTLKNDEQISNTFSLTVSIKKSLNNCYSEPFPKIFGINGALNHL